MNIKHIIFAWQYKRAVKKANRMARTYGERYFVINLNGHCKVIAKRVIKYLVKTHHFKKGVKVEDIERMALYITRATPEHTHYCTTSTQSQYNGIHN